MRRIICLVADLLLVTLATVSALVLRDNLELSIDHLSSIVPYTMFSLGGALVVLPVLGADRVLWRYSTLGDYLRLVAAAVLVVASACVCSFLFNRLEYVPRALPLLQGILLAAMLVGIRVVSRLIYSLRNRPAVPNAEPAMPTVTGDVTTVLVVGLTRLTDLYLRSATEFAPRTIRVAGLLGQKEKFTGSSVHQHTVIGTPEDVAAIVRNLEVHGVFVDAIVIAKRFDTLSSQAQQALLQLEASSTIRLVFLTESLGFDGRRKAEASSEPAGDSRVAFAYSDRQIKALNQRPYWRVKRLIDIVVSSVMLLICAPIMLVVALLVAVDIGSPVTFWQQRPGRGGRPIHVSKFRTMGSAHDSQGQRIADDKRLSVIGSFLRRSRLDELPQLINILMGEMSFVGPRPLLPVDQAPEYSARLLVRPGLTGWAQVNGGRSVSAADKAALDVWYVQNASIMLDLRILLRTIPMVIFGERIRPLDIQRAWRELQDAGICAPNAFTPVTDAAGRLGASNKRVA